MQPANNQGDPIEDQQYLLECVVDARPNPDVNGYKWWRGSTLLSETSNTLTQILDHTNHDGEYKCSAKNEVGDGNVGDKYDLKVYCKKINCFV